MHRKTNTPQGTPDKQGCGTGVLVYPKHKKGWLIFTNKHLIMNEEEIKDAEIIFDYDKDGVKAAMVSKKSLQHPHIQI